jgi:hypothetical protein
MDEHPDLPSALDRRVDEGARELGGEQIFDRNPTPVNALEGFDRRGREPDRISVEFDE